MANSSSNYNVRIGLAGLATILFIVLKLTNSPLWVPFAIALVIISLITLYDIFNDI